MTAQAVQTTATPSDTAPAGRGMPRGLLAGVLGVWGLIGASVLWIIVFGGYDGRPVADLATANPLQHHTIFGPIFLAWAAFSAILVPRTLLAFFRRD